MILEKLYEIPKRRRCQGQNQLVVGTYKKEVCLEPGIWTVTIFFVVGVPGKKWARLGPARRSE